MRPVRLLAGIALVLVSGVPVPAQNVLYSAVVSVPETEVRSGPGLEMSPTNRLDQGKTVQVLENRGDGWLAIKPPPGSFSWINVRFLQKIGPLQWSVENDVPVPVYYGSQLVNSPPTVQSVRVPRGTIVVSIGEPQTTGQISQTGLDGKWLPIQPPPTEKRYLRADAVQPFQAVQTASSKTSSSPLPTSPPTLAPIAAAASSPGSVQPAANPDPLWLQAQRAEQEGNIEDAEQLYIQLANQTPDHDLALACQNRIRSLYELKHSQLQSGASGVRLTNAYPVGPDSRLAPTPPNPHAQLMAAAPASQAGNATSQYCYVRDGTAAAGQVVSASAAPSPALSPVPARSGPGWLRRTGFQLLDGKPVFALEANPRGQLHLYVTAGPGVDLEPYLHKQVELYGPVVYHSELRANHMTVTQVVPLP